VILSVYLNQSLINHQYSSPIKIRPHSVLVWKLNPDNPVNTPLLLIAIMIACFTVFNVFYFGKRISKVLGVGRIRVITRLMGLLLAVIAVQFMINGFKQIQFEDNRLKAALALAT
jgi:hypothetical protein